MNMLHESINIRSELENKTNSSYFIKGYQKKNNRSNFGFLISIVKVIGSSKFLCPSPIIRGVLWGVDTKILKIRSPGLEL